MLKNYLLRHQYHGKKQPAKRSFKMIKCPSCSKINKPAKRIKFAGAKQQCPSCQFTWIEPSLVLKKHREARYSRLFDLHQLLRQRQYQDLDDKFNHKEISAQKYSDEIAKLESRDENIEFALETVYAK